MGKFLTVTKPDPDGRINDTTKMIIIRDLTFM